MIYLSYYLQTCLRSIWSHALVNYFSPLKASLWQSAYFILRLSARTFKGLVRKADSPLLSFLSQLARLTSSHWCIFLFYKVRCPTPWTSGKIFGATICSWWPPSIVLSPTFLDGAPKLSYELDCTFRGIWLGSFLPIFPVVYALVSRFIIHMIALYLRRSCGIVLIPWFPFERGSKVFWGTASQLQAIYQEFFSLPSGI